MTVVPPSADRLRRSMPPFHAPGSLFDSLLAATGAQLDVDREAFASLGDNAFVSRATWAIGRWEDQLGLERRPTLPLADRVARCLRHYRGLDIPSGIALQQLVQEGLSQSAYPSLIVQPGWWAVYKLADQGWPGDVPFRQVQTALGPPDGNRGSMGPAHLGHYLAPNAACLGLSFANLDHVYYQALEILTIAEMQGGYCTLPSCAPEQMLDYINTLPLDAVNPQDLGLYEYCELGPTGYDLERFAAVPLRFQPVSMEQMNSIDLVELLDDTPPEAEEADILLDVVHVTPLDAMHPFVLNRLQEDA